MIECNYGSKLMKEIFIFHYLTNVCLKFSINYNFKGIFNVLVQYNLINL